MYGLLRLAPTCARTIAARPLARAVPVVARRTMAGPAGHSNLDATIANYPTAHDLDPSSKSDYEKYVTFWRGHFQNVEDDFELERGLNHIFSTDWVPSIEVISDALQASRKLNTFATAVRVLEALKEKTHNDGQYQQYLKELAPLMQELGLVEKKDLGEYELVREKRWWMQ